MISLLILLVAKELSFQALYLAEENQPVLSSYYYEKALEEEKQLWKRSVIHYNLGTLLLKEDKPKEALYQFSLAWSDSMPDYLYQPLQKNVELAFEKISLSPPFNASQLVGLAKDQVTLYESNDNRAIQTIQLGLTRLSFTKNLLEMMIFVRAAGKEPFSELTGAFQRQVAKLYETLRPFPKELVKWEKELFEDNHCVKTPFREALFKFDEAMMIPESSHVALLNEKRYVLESEELAFMQEKLESLLQLLKKAEEMEESSPEEMREQSVDDRVVEMHWQDEQVEQKPTGTGEWVEKPW